MFHHVIFYLESFSFWSLLWLVLLGLFVVKVNKPIYFVLIKKYIFFKKITKIMVSGMMFFSGSQMLDRSAKKMVKRNNN